MTESLSYRDFITTFRNLGLRRNSHVLVHASLEGLGPVAGGPDTIIGSLLATCESVLMPTFTPECALTPPVGPPDNAIDYGTDPGKNLEAEFYVPDLPTAEPVAERLRQHANARRSVHPLLSFAGIKADEALEGQTIDEPLGPIGWLAEFDGDVLLLGTDQRANVSLHYGERAAGRRQFTRWALTPEAVVVCPDCPGCSEGFGAIASRLDGIVRRQRLGRATAELIPLRDLINITVGWVRQDPRALLCDRPECVYCRAVRASVRVPS
jgi:aminoglycoside 3-N-acetyltransferase